MTWLQWIAFIKWLMGGIAAIGVFVLVQDGVPIPPLVELVIGGFVTFAAYVDPSAVAGAVRPGLKPGDPAG